MNQLLNRESIDKIPTANCFSTMLFACTSERAEAEVWVLTSVGYRDFWKIYARRGIILYAISNYYALPFLSVTVFKDLNSDFGASISGCLIDFKPVNQSYRLLLDSGPRLIRGSPGSVSSSFFINIAEAILARFTISRSVF